LIVFIFFESILGLRFPPGIITNIYYNWYGKFIFNDGSII
jgi:hypothetical protein